MPLGVPLALGALVTLTKPNVEEMFQARFVVGELLEELYNGHCLVLGHG